jgi:hypothetical protein
MKKKRLVVGGEKYWRQYAFEHSLGKPTSVETRPVGYRIFWGEHTVYTPFFGGPRAKKKLIADLTKWSLE